MWICFIVVLCSIIFCNYKHEQKRLQYLLDGLESLDQKYLAAEIINRPETKLEQVYFRLMKSALKSMTDEVAQSQRLNNEYRDFIEQWIHEIKVPITGIKLVCENNKTDITRKIIMQTERIEQDVERVLFYARLGKVEKDYLIKEIRLRDCVMEVLAQNKQFLIQNGVCVYTEAVSDTVYSDDKCSSFCVWDGKYLSFHFINTDNRVDISLFFSNAFVFSLEKRKMDTQGKLI